MKTSKNRSAPKNFMNLVQAPMIIETHYVSKKEVLAMTLNNFTVDGVEFLITGTHIKEFDECVCDVKNTSTGQTKEIEHQKLCRIIKDSQNKS